MTKQRKQQKKQTIQTNLAAPNCNSQRQSQSNLTPISEPKINLQVTYL